MIIQFNILGQLSSSYYSHENIGLVGFLYKVLFKNIKMATEDFNFEQHKTSLFPPNDLIAKFGKKKKTI